MNPPCHKQAGFMTTDGDMEALETTLDSSFLSVCHPAEGEQGLWRQAVQLWMQWHMSQERLTAAMFRSRHDTALQAELLQEMDQLDQLRWRAVELSQEMLDHASELASDSLS